MAEGPLHYLEYAEQMWKEEEAEGREFLLARGITDEAATRFSLGYVASPIQGDQKFKDRICIPYFDAMGRCTNTRYRRLSSDSSQPKYLQPHGVPVGLFNVSSTTADSVYITEGEFDAIILEQMGYAAVGVPGARAWKGAWRWLFRESSQVTLVTDPDQDGQDLASTIARDLASIGLDPRIIRLPGLKDINEWYIEDKDRLQELIT